jgi:hypothetical protein
MLSVGAVLEMEKPGCVHAQSVSVGRLLVSVPASFRNVSSPPRLPWLNLFRRGGALSNLNQARPQVHHPQVDYGHLSVRVEHHRPPARCCRVTSWSGRPRKTSESKYRLGLGGGEMGQPRNLRSPELDRFSQ